MAWIACSEWRTARLEAAFVRECGCDWWTSLHGGEGGFSYAIAYGI